MNGYISIDTPSNKEGKVGITNFIGQTIYRKTFETATDFTDPGAGRLAAFTINTTNFKTSTGSLNCTKNSAFANDYGEVTWNVPEANKDFTNCHGMFRFYIPAGIGLTSCNRMSSIVIKLYSDATNYTSYNIWNYEGCGNGTGANDGSINAGWYETYFTTNYITGAASAANLANIVKIGVFFQWRFSSTEGDSSIPVGCSVTACLDEFFIFKPNTSKPLAIFTTDATYTLLPNLATYFTTLMSTGYKPLFVVNTNVTELDIDAHISTASMVSIIKAGHLIGTYGEDDPDYRWVNTTDAGKLNAFAKMVNVCRDNDLPTPIVMAISGTRGIKPSDWVNSLAAPLTVTGQYNYANAVCTNSLYNPQYCQITSSPSASAPLAEVPCKTTATTDIITIDSTQSMYTGVNWIGMGYSINGVIPAKFFGAGVTNSGLNTTTLYWLRILTQVPGSGNYSTAKVYTTYNDALNGTNNVDLLIDRTGWNVYFNTPSELKYDNKLYGWMNDKSLWCFFGHCDNANMLAYAKFQADIIASLVVSGNVDWVIPYSTNANTLY